MTTEEHDEPPAAREMSAAYAASRTMTPQAILDELKRAFKVRKFVPGLLIAFMRTLDRLGATCGVYANLGELYAAHPLKRTAGAGQRNAWAVVVDPALPHTPKNVISIRPAYNGIERWFYEQKRYDYPSMAPHATQAWPDYQNWLEALLTFDAEELAWLEQRVRTTCSNSFRRTRWTPRW